jgi:DNA-binding CsgD family transcriptional regulator
MTDHLSITTKDLRRLLDLTDPARVDEPGNPLPWSLLTGLMNLVGCDGVTYESHDVANTTVIHHQSTSRFDGGGNFADEAVQNSFWGLYWHGLCDYWPRTGDYTSVRRMLAEKNWPSWSGTAYFEWVRSFGIHGEMTVAFPPDGGLHHRLLLWRFGGRDFTERDCLLLTLIQPHLALLHAAIRRRQAGTVDLTPRQWELMRLIAAGNTNRQIASQLVLSEGTVRTHCEHIFQRLQVNNRLAAVARAFPTETASVLTPPRQEADRVPSETRAAGVAQHSRA